jgi:hypothetical protein
MVFNQCTLFTCNFSLVIKAFKVSCEMAYYRKSGNFGHGFILVPKYEVPKLSTPKYVTLKKLTAKIEHCLNIFLAHLTLWVR